MTKKVFVLILFSNLLGHEPKKDIPQWTVYGRGGLVNVSKNKLGGAAYSRLKRTTNYTFRDVRLYANIFGSDEDIRFRQKSSRIFVTLPWLYNFTTASYQRNTLIDVALRYHYNQGLGVLIQNTENGNTTTEMGMAYDMSDYIENDHKSSYLKRKTSYLKFAFTHDKDFQKISTKIEFDYFYQISDINVYDLSRIQILGELQLRLHRNLRLISGLYQEIPKNIIEHRNKNILLYITLDWNKKIQWFF